MAPEKDTPLGSAQKIVDLLKNFVLLCAIGYSLYYGAGAIKKVSGDITAGRSEITKGKISKEGIEFEVKNLKDIQENLTSALDGMAKTEGKKDTPVSAQSKEVATALKKTNVILDQVSNDRSQSPESDAAGPSVRATWVYLGIAKDHKWSPNYFGLDKTPEVGMSITSNTDVFERATKPVYEDSIKDWKLGNVNGVFRRGDCASVKELEQIEADNGGTNWWARIQ